MIDSPIRRVWHVHQYVFSWGGTGGRSKSEWPNTEEDRCSLALLRRRPAQLEKGSGVVFGLLLADARGCCCCRDSLFDEPPARRLCRHSPPFRRTPTTARPFEGKLSVASRRRWRTYFLLLPYETESFLLKPSWYIPDQELFSAKMGRNYDFYSQTPWFYEKITSLVFYPKKTQSVVPRAYQQLVHFQKGSKYRLKLNNVFFECEICW